MNNYKKNIQIDISNYLADIKQKDKENSSLNNTISQLNMNIKEIQNSNMNVNNEYTKTKEELIRSNEIISNIKAELGNEIKKYEDLDRDNKDVNKRYDLLMIEFNSYRQQQELDRISFTKDIERLKEEKETYKIERERYENKINDIYKEKGDKENYIFELKTEIQQLKNELLQVTNLSNVNRS